MRSVGFTVIVRGRRRRFWINFLRWEWRWSYCRGIYYARLETPLFVTGYHPE